MYHDCIEIQHHRGSRISKTLVLDEPCSLGPFCNNNPKKILFQLPNLLSFGLQSLSHSFHWTCYEAFSEYKCWKLLWLNLRIIYSSITHARIQRFYVGTFRHFAYWLEWLCLTTYWKDMKNSYHNTNSSISKTGINSR